MDWTVCAAVSMLEALVVQQRTASHGWIKTILVLFIVQYLGIKYYRIFLYPHYFSPLRQLPGPTVSGRPRLSIATITLPRHTG